MLLHAYLLYIFYTITPASVRRIASCMRAIANREVHQLAAEPRRRDERIFISQFLPRGECEKSRCCAIGEVQRCSFAARGRVCSMHEEAVPTAVIATETGRSADRSHDLSFPALSGPPPPRVRLYFSLYPVAFISRLIPGNEVTNYGPNDRSRRAAHVSKLRAV